MVCLTARICMVSYTGQCQRNPLYTNRALQHSALRAACQLVTARCSGSEPMRTWSHERLLRRPQTQDSLLGRGRHAQGPGGSHLLREPLLGQTIRKQGPKGRTSNSEEEARIDPEARREGDEATPRRPNRAPVRHPPRALRVRRVHDGALGEPLHDVPCHSQDRSNQEKGGRVATERDEFLRAAWREMVAARVD